MRPKQFIYVVAERTDGMLGVEIWSIDGRDTVDETPDLIFPKDQFEPACAKACWYAGIDNTFAFIEKTSVVGRPTLELIWPPPAGSREGEDD